jgi:lysozyme family protein
VSDPFDTLIGPLITREGDGKFTNDPSDRGGPTRWGIPAKKLGEWRKLGRPATAAEVRALERPEAVAIYRAECWTRPGFDSVHAVAPKVAAELFDTGVNMGVRTAGKFLQRSLNLLNRRGRDYPDVTVDGVIGPATLRALSALVTRRGDQVLVTAMNVVQGARYVEICEADETQEDNINGWLAQRVGLAA